MEIIEEYQKIGEVHLNPGEQCLTEMAVTNDHKLLICGYDPFRVSIYQNYDTYATHIALTSRPECITVIPDTHRAVVTLPTVRSIQFINTDNNTMEDPIMIGEECLGVTAGRKNIYIGVKDKVLILNIDGSPAGEIPTAGSINYNLVYNENNGQLWLKQGGRLCCINLDGEVIHDHMLSELYGLALNQQGHVFISRGNPHVIQRRLPDGTFHVVSGEHDDVQEPRGMTFSNDFSKLFVINRRGCTVLIYGRT